MRASPPCTRSRGTPRATHADRRIAPRCASSGYANGLTISIQFRLAREDIGGLGHAPEMLRMSVALRREERSDLPERERVRLLLGVCDVALVSSLHREEGGLRQPYPQRNPR